jgi:hypothetical protein
LLVQIARDVREFGGIVGKLELKAGRLRNKIYSIVAHGMGGLREEVLGGM